MKHFNLNIATLFLCLSNNQSFSIDKASWNDIINQAEEKHIDISEEKINLQISQQQEQKYANKLFLPQINFGLNGNFNRTFSGPITDSPVTNSKWQHDATLAIEQNLFRGNTDYRYWQAQKLSTKASETKIKLLRQSIAKELFDLWIDLYTEHQALKVFLSNEEKSNTLQKFLDIQFKNGLISANDHKLNQIENVGIKINVKDAKLKTENAKTKLQSIAQFDFKNREISFDSEVLLTDEILKQLQNLQQQSRQDVINKFMIQYQKNNEKLSYNLLLQQVNNEFSALRHEEKNVPQLTLGAYWSYGGQKDRNPYLQDPMSIQLKFSYPIYTAFDRLNDQEIVNLNQQKEQIKIEKEKVNASQELILIFDDLINAYTSLELLKERIQYQKTLVGYSEERYRRGTLDLRELLRDKQSLLENELNITRQEGKLLKQIFKLEQLLGIKITET